MYEQKRNTFKNIHKVFPSILAKLSKQYNLKHFIHLSALGINEAIDWIMPKVAKGEMKRKKFPFITILRPSIVYSVEDKFSNSFMTLLNRLPFFLYYGVAHIVQYIAQT